MEITSCKNGISYAINCIICGEATTVPHLSAEHYQYVICDNCKKAVLYVRKQINDKTENKTTPIKLSKKSLDILKEKGLNK